MGSGGRDWRDALESECETVWKIITLGSEESKCQWNEKPWADGREAFSSPFVRKIKRPELGGFSRTCGVIE